ncbi:MAG: BTAD domain-containing putative transcriptional regulator [Bacillota bacterium]
MDRSSIKISEQSISIHTFGKFYIQDGAEIISNKQARSRKMWEIFKFLLSHPGKAFFPEVILDKIWPENDYADPNLVLRAQIYRLRQVLGDAHSNPNLAANIVYSQGCYGWENRTDYWLDTNEFTAIADEAQPLVAGDPDRAIDLYMKAVSLYKGEYLPEISFSEWLEPLRATYHETYLNYLLILIELLKDKRGYPEIIKLCEQALSIDYFEERIHLKLIEALLAEDQVTRARAHYNEATSAFYREMGIKPSEPMRSLYRLIESETKDFELDLTTIQERLKGKEAANGAYLCDPELFRYFYKLERLRTERSGQSILLGLLTLTGPNYRPAEKGILKEVMNNLEGVILDSLRKGDLVTRWNDAQFLLMLPGLNREQSDNVIERIENNFHEKYSLLGLNFHKKVESPLPLENDPHFV